MSTMLLDKGIFERVGNKMISCIHTRDLDDLNQGIACAICSALKIYGYTERKEIEKWCNDLYDQNRRAYFDRYGDKVSYVQRENLVFNPDFSFNYADAMQLLKRLECIDYQNCDATDYKTDSAISVLPAKIAKAILSTSHLYQSFQWGY